MNIQNDELAALQAQTVKRQLYLNGAAVVLLIVAMIGLWQIIANFAPVAKTPSIAFYVSIVLTVLSFILLTYVLIEESKLSVKVRLDTDYQTRLDQVQRRLDYREELLKLISDHQTTAIAIFDRHNRYYYVNEVVAQKYGKLPVEIIGLPPIKLMPNEQAKRLEVRLAEARATEEPIEVTERDVDEKGVTRFIKRHFEPVSDFADIEGCVLLREEDLTDLIVERERREQMLKQVIDTLVAVVDRRDPYATGHSSRVGQLSAAVAKEMGLDKLDVEAAEIAGSLMNFGKVLVSRKILTKTSALTPEELQRVRDSILISADILAIIGFEGPVVPTLRQVLERYDGTGAPEGLRGDEILLTARIVAACNAFVAFVSPRAHRDGLAFHDALDAMGKDVGKAFDERVYIAMRHFIENRSGSLEWLTANKLVNV